MRELLFKYAVLLAPPFAAMLLLVIKGAWKRLNSEVSAIVSVLFLFAAVFFAWRGFLGEIYFGDGLAAISAVILSSAGILSVILSVSYLDRFSLPAAEFMVLLILAIFGSFLLTGTTDLLVLFIGLESLSFAAYIMAGYNKNDHYSSEAAIKYFVLGGLASAVLLFGIALYYGAVGSLRLFSGAIRDPILFHLSVAFMLTGLAFKASLVPFQWWAPDVYQGSPLPVTAFFSTVIKGAAFIVLFRVVSIISPDIVYIVSAVAVATMFFGNLAALFQDDLKRLLAYSSIAHAGYMLLALTFAGKNPSAAQAQLLFYITAYIVMTLGAFAFLVYLTLQKGGDREETQITAVSGLAKRIPVMAIVFAIFMFSLAGVPPLGGFFAKFYLFSGLVDTGHVILAVVAVINSLISVYYYMRPVVKMFFEDGSGVTVKGSVIQGYSVMGVISFCAIATVLIGIFPNVILAIVTR